MNYTSPPSRVQVELLKHRPLELSVPFYRQIIQPSYYPTCSPILRRRIPTHNDNTETCTYSTRIPPTSKGVRPVDTNNEKFFITAIVSVRERRIRVARFYGRGSAVEFLISEKAGGARGARQLSELRAIPLARMRSKG